MEYDHPEVSHGQCGGEETYDYSSLYTCYFLAFILDVSFNCGEGGTAAMTLTSPREAAESGADPGTANDRHTAQTD